MRAPRSSWKCTRTSGTRPASTRPPTTSSRPASPTKRRSPRSASIFAEELDGYEVLSNNSKWLNFTTVRNQSWRHNNVVLLGDAAHTAHFSIGSGTKLAMEDSLALAACLHEHPDVESALGRLRGRAPTRGRIHPACCPGLAGMVRAHRPVQGPGPHPVRVQPAHPQPPHHPGKPAPARPRIRRGRGPRLRRIPGPGRGCAGHVPAVPHRRAGTEEPDRGLARWTCTPPWTASRATSTRSTWAPRPLAAPAWS